MAKKSIGLIALLSLLSLLLPLGSRAQQAAAPTIEKAAAAPVNRTGRAISSELSASKNLPQDSDALPSEILLRNWASNELGPDATPTQIELRAAELKDEWLATSYHGPESAKLAELVTNERAIAKGDTQKARSVEGTLRLLTVAVEFDGTDSVTNFSHPISIDNRTCITETISYEGPRHNEIPMPGPRDNFSGWREDYNQEYYEKLVLSTSGITERVRPDLIDPEDGLPGIDVSGQSMRNYFEEVSGGRVQFDTGPAGVIAWVPLPHSEAYYAADACFDGDAGRVQSRDGLPTNPRFGPESGMDQLLVDMIDKINEDNPNFPWDEYDLDDDGVIDHVVVFHAGKDRSAGGGVQNYTAIWAHRGTIDTNGYVADDNGTPGDTSDDVRMVGYTMQYEDVETGVLVHEFGHDLGLPDLYDTSGVGESSVVWWDLMSTGSNTGKLIGTHPTHMGAWSKAALGWVDTKVVTPTAERMDELLGQTSRPPVGTAQALRVNLPDHVTEHVELPTGSTLAWWTGHDQNWADVRLTRDVNLVGATGPISITFDLDYVIEEDWDYMFLEVSTDGGQTYTQTKGFEVGTGIELTTPDDYTDPNGRLGDFGDLRYGYTGDTHGWLRASHDLTAYAGQNIKVRFRYATDAAFLERGGFIDNISITAGATTILNDPVEAANGWVPTIGSFTTTDPLGRGWLLSNGNENFANYYLLEWRNYNGFDEGLRYTYNTVFSTLTQDGRQEFRVDRVPSNVPGMVVYYRDTRFGLDPFEANNNILSGGLFWSSPSEGPKGGLLVVDSHPEPLRGPRGGTFTTSIGTYPFPARNNWSGRVQTTNSAFGPNSSAPITLTQALNFTNPNTTILTPTFYPPQAGVKGFHDSLGYFPGIEQLSVPISTTATNARRYALKDPDASVVIPAEDYYPMRTPAGFTGTSTNGNRFETLTTFDMTDALVGSTFCGANVLGTTSTVFDLGACAGYVVTGEQTGNPGDYEVQHGMHFKVVQQSPGAAYAKVQLWRADYSSDLDATVGSAPIGSAFPVAITVANVGSPTPLTVFSDFDETAATYVEGSATNGAIPVRSTAAQVREAYAARGYAGVKALEVAADEATGVVWVSGGELLAGQGGSFGYQLTRNAQIVPIDNYVFGTNIADIYPGGLAVATRSVYLPLAVR